MPFDPTSILRPGSPAATAVITALAAVLSLLAALGMTGPFKTHSGGSSVESSSEQQAPYEPNDQSSREDLVNEHEVQWTHHEVIANGNEEGTAVRVYFTMGTPSCYGIRTEVEESPTAVSIKVFEGALPDAPEHCIAIAMMASTVVELGKPLGTRSVQD